jgi:hypothetical protein
MPEHKAPALPSLEELLERYPEEKPVCFNYRKAREDVLRLCEIIQEQQQEIETRKGISQ